MNLILKVNHRYVRISLMKAHNFNLPDQDNKLHALESYKGKWVVLYFYPEDDTPGCTKEACSFRDNLANLQDLGVIVLGVSKDSVSSNKKFAQKYHLNFPLLEDTKGFTIKAYNVLGRTTYLINPEGDIAKVYEKVDPINHAELILKFYQRK